MHALRLRKLKIDSVTMNITDKIRLLFCKDKKSYLLLYDILGFLPRNLKHYNIALTHSSLASGRQKKIFSNERLEFLGDAVLSSIVSEYLYTHYRKEREGFLSKSRSRIVCRESLNAVALEIGLDKLVTSSKLVQQHNSYIYGNAFEAFIGAIYVDLGYAHCRRFIFEKVLSKLIDVDAVAMEDKNYKSRLIEWSQKERHEVSFVLQSEERRSDGCYFVSDVLVDGAVRGHGEGFSKRESHQMAAKEALEHILQIKD